MIEFTKICLWIAVIGDFGAAIMWILGNLFHPEQVSFSLMGEHLQSLVFKATVCLGLLALLSQKEPK
jgi:hypothetical protein